MPRLLAIVAKAKKLLPVPIKAKIKNAPATAFCSGLARTKPKGTSE